MTMASSSSLFFLKLFFFLLLLSSSSSFFFSSSFFHDPILPSPILSYPILSSPILSPPVLSYPKRCFSSRRGSFEPEGEANSPDESVETGGKQRRTKTGNGEKRKRDNKQFVRDSLERSSSGDRDIDIDIDSKSKIDSDKDSKTDNQSQSQSQIKESKEKQEKQNEGEKKEQKKVKSMSRKKKEQEQEQVISIDILTDEDLELPSSSSSSSEKSMKMKKASGSASESGSTVITSDSTSTFSFFRERVQSAVEKSSENSREERQKRKKAKVIVVGGGWAGLSAVYELSKGVLGPGGVNGTGSSSLASALSSPQEVEGLSKGQEESSPNTYDYEVVLLEANPQTGGLVSTLKVPSTIATSSSFSPSSAAATAAATTTTPTPTITTTTVPPSSPLEMQQSNSNSTIGSLKTTESGIHTFFSSYRNIFHLVENQLQLKNVFTDWLSSAQYGPLSSSSSSSSSSCFPLRSKLRQKWNLKKLRTNSFRGRRQQSGESRSQLFSNLQLIRSSSFPNMPQAPLPLPFLFLLYANADSLKFTRKDIASLWLLSGALLDFDTSNPEKWKEYDQITAVDLFRKIGLRRKVYQQLIEPLLLVSLGVSGQQCSAAACLAMFSYYGLTDPNSFDFCICQGSVEEKIFVPWKDRIQENGARIEMNKAVQKVNINNQTGLVESINVLDISKKHQESLGDNEEKKAEREAIVPDRYECDYLIMATGITGIQKIIQRSPSLNVRNDFAKISQLNSITCLAIRLYLDQYVNFPSLLTGIIRGACDWTDFMFISSFSGILFKLIVFSFCCCCAC